VQGRHTRAELGAQVAQRATVRARTVEPRELATVRKRHGPTPGKGLQDDCESAGHCKLNYASVIEDPTKKFFLARNIGRDGALLHTDGVYK
jgi:hypothetical protein